MERRFVIREIGPEYGAINYITESELKRRLDVIGRIYMTQDWDYNEAINLLLQREKEEPDAWDKWVERMPNFMIADVWSRDNWKAWLRACPCRR